MGDGVRMAAIVELEEDGDRRRRWASVGEGRSDGGEPFDVSAGVDDPAPPSPEELALVAEARGRLDELADHVYAAVARSVPSYGLQRAAGEREDMLHGVAFSVSLFLRTTAERRLPTAAERAALQRIGAQRFRQGVAVPELLATVEVARRAGYRFLLGLLPAVTGDARVQLEVAASLADRLSVLIPIVADALVEGHRSAQNLPVVDCHARAVVVDRVLERRWSEVADIVAHAGRVGIDLTVPWGAVFVLPRTGSWSPPAAVRRLGEVFAAVTPGQPRCTPVHHVPVLVRSHEGESWDAAVARLDEVGRAGRLLIVHDAPCDPLGTRAAVCSTTAGARSPASPAST